MANMTSGEGGTTRRLAKFAASLKFEDIPQIDVAAAKTTILDAIGCAFVGIADHPAKAVADYIAEMGGRQDATLWGRSVRVPAAQAALALGTAVHAHAFDDSQNRMHVAAVVVPASIAVGEREGVDGRQFLSAVVSGYETMMRVGRGLNTARAFMRGWRGTGVCGPVGAAASVGLLMGASSDTMASAFGLAGNQATGLVTSTVDESLTLRFDAGRAAQTGVISAELASRGVGGSPSVLENAHGGLFTAISDAWNLERVTEGLGSTFFTHQFGNKLVPVGMSLVAGVQAMQELVSGRAVSAADVERIVLRTARPCVQEFSGQPPEGGSLPARQLQAQISAPYVLSTVLLHRTFTMGHLGPDHLSNPIVADLGTRVSVECDDKIDARYPDKFGCGVDIYLRDGAVLSRTIEHPDGGPGVAYSFEQIADKFVSLAHRSGHGSRAQEVIGVVGRLEQLKDISTLTGLL